MASKAPLLVLSLGTSGLLLFAASVLSATVSGASFVSLVFFSLLPALVSITVVIEGRGWGFFMQVWETLVTLLAVGRQDQEHKVTPTESLKAARAELFKAFSERWPYSGQPSLNPLGLSSQRPEVVSSSTRGSSLYEQVKGNLADHMFNQSALVYLMDPTTGYFLRATQHRKLVFTTKPNTSCLFHVERGKTHHWGFRSADTRRYVGQNLVQRMVVASKKLHAWEAFRVLQRPEDKGAGGCSPRVYLILSAARFGKGMWLANRPGSTSFAHPAVPTSRKNVWGLEMEEESTTNDDRSSRGRPQNRGLFLSKQFDHAIGFVYSSDISTLMATAADAGAQSDLSSASRALARAQTAPHLIEDFLQAKDAVFKAPMLAKWDLGGVQLPWLADTNADPGQAPSFLEMSAKEMTEVMVATIPGSSVYEFLEIVAPRATRRKCLKNRSLLAQSAPVGSSMAAMSKTSTSGEKRGSDGPHCDWHAHANFGLVRALSHRSEASPLPNHSITGSSRGIAKSAASSTVKSMIVEQYHSCTVDNDCLDDGAKKDVQTPQKAALRSKIYPLSIPYSNCFSIEVLVDVEDVPIGENEAKERNSFVSDAEGKSAIDSSSGSALHIRWRAGVVFSRNTMLKTQIEHGALDGVRSSCALVLKRLRDKDMKQRFVSPVVSHGSLDGANSRDATTDSSSSRGAREKPPVKPDLAFLPLAFSLEITKELLSAIDDTRLLSNHLSTLAVQLPWRPYSGGQSSMLGAVTPHAAIATTAFPFFESAPEEFAQVLEENMGSKVTAPLFFEALLSDVCSFFRSVHADSGTMEVDISIWRAFAQSSKRTNGYIRKQVFQMPLKGIPGVKVATVEDFQYYALEMARSQDPSMSALGQGTDSSRGDKRGIFIQRAGGSQVSMGRDKTRPPSGSIKDAKVRETKPHSSNSQRLEFGMKLFVPALPEGSELSIEVLVIVEPADDAPSSTFLRIFFALPPRHRHPETRGHAAVNPHVVAGVLRGLKQIWKQVAQSMVESCEATGDYTVRPHQCQLPTHTRQRLNLQETHFLQQLRANPNLPTHDELASKLITAIAAVYS